MAMRQVNENIFSVGAQDWDRRIFDELIPLPDGTSYNSYLVRGSQKTALVDTVDPTKVTELLANLKKFENLTLDYVIVNHAEQDHSGGLPFVLQSYPHAKVVTNVKCKEFLKDHLAIPEERFFLIDAATKLSLGDKTFSFFLTPWVHWPETMVSFLEQDRILFSCDLFGSHLASSELFVSDFSSIHPCAKRYYAEIMMPFRKQITGYLEVVNSLAPTFIAPSHGPVYHDPKQILQAYSSWVGDAAKNLVLIPYISMHGSTKLMAERLTQFLEERKVPVKLLNLRVTDIGEFAMELVDAATVVFASPTVLTGAHPVIVGAVYLMNALRPKTKFIAYIGSYGWGGKLIESLQALSSSLHAERLPSLLVKGCPGENDFQKLSELADTILQKHSLL